MDEVRRHGREESPRVPPDTRGDYALISIREDLVAGRLLPGSKVTAEELAARLGISHVPVREALRFLEAQGHLERDHRGRLRVRPTSADEAEEVYHLREILEAEVHDQAVPRLTDQDVANVEIAFQEMEDALAVGDIPGYARANRRFHFTVFERSGRSWMLRFLTMIWDAAARYQSELFIGTGWERRLQDQHRALLDAFRARDAATVNVLMEEHRKLSVEAAHRRELADPEDLLVVPSSYGGSTW